MTRLLKLALATEKYRPEREKNLARLQTILALQQKSDLMPKNFATVTY